MPRKEVDELVEGINRAIDAARPACTMSYAEVYGALEAVKFDILRESIGEGEVHCNRTMELKRKAKKD